PCVKGSGHGKDGQTSAFGTGILGSFSFESIFLFKINFIILSAVRFTSLMDQAAVAMDIDVKISVEFQHAAQDLPLLFDGSRRDLEIAQVFEGMMLLVCGIKI